METSIRLRAGDLPRRLRRGAAGLLVLLLAGCGTGPRSAPVNPRLPETALCLYGPGRALAVEVELAQTREQRRLGLMGRERLAPNSGMLFVYEEPRQPDSGFWMYRTLIPLDIAFLGADGEIRAIRSMQPCKASEPAGCRSYAAGVVYQAALEMNQGFFERHGFRPGDRVVELGSGPCPDSEDRGEENRLEERRE